MKKNARGQASFEFVLALLAGIIPITLGLLAFCEIFWTYHALATLTRQGARYAATHCFEDDTGSNVVRWMQANAPAFPDRPMLTTGDIQIQVNYWMHDTENHETVGFSCAGNCSPDCVPDSVTISITGYTFNHFFSGLGLPGLQMPAFSTTVAMESAGADPETDVSSP